jgi:hypothetical protein
MKKATDVGLAADILSPTLAIIIRGLRRGMYWHLAQGCTYIYGNEQITTKIGTTLGGIFHKQRD